MKISRLAKKVVDLILDFFYPKKCESCGASGTYLCESCARNRIPSHKQYCHVCKKEIITGLVHPSCRSKTSLDGVFIATKYTKFIESYLADIKYEFYYAMIPDLMFAVCHNLSRNKIFQDVIYDSVITFVPLHRSRKRWRGFNQSEIISKYIAKAWGKDCCLLIERKRRTKTQVGLKRKERLNNLKDSFCLKRE